MTPDNIMFDIRDRLARIEVKFDNTHETLKSHDKRLEAVEGDVEKLQTAHTAYKAKVATYVQLGGGVAVVGAIVAWFLDHAGTVASVAAAVPH